MSSSNITKHSSQLYVFIKSLSNGDAIYATILLNRVSDMIKTEAHLKEDNESLENKIVNNINYFISTYLTNQTNISKDSKYVIARALISESIQSKAKLENIRVRLGLDDKFYNKII